MAAPRRRPNHNKSNQQNGPTWTSWLVRNGLFIATGVGVYYAYKRYSRPQTLSPRQMSPDSTLIHGYHPTPLGPDYDDTDDTNLNTTFYTNESTAGDGRKMSVRGEYIATLLQQRRFSSVLNNPHLNHHNVEAYFHLGFDSASPILARFNRIKWVIVVRSKSDVELVARRILDDFPQFAEEKDDGQLPKPVGSTDRFYMIQMASIVIVSCGIGASSISILLQEITKLLVDAGAFAPNESNTALHFQTSYVEYILLMTAPGIKTSPNAKVYRRRKSLDNIFDDSSHNKSGTPPNVLTRSKSGSTTPRGSTRFGGLSSLRVDLKAQRQKTSQLFGHSNVSRGGMDDDSTDRPSQRTQGEVPVIIPTSVYNEILNNYRVIVACGQQTGRQMKFDRNLISDIKIRCSFLRSLKPKMGKGLSVKYFHEALSHNSVVIQQDSNVKSKFIQNCIDLNIKYVDMESGYFSAFCNKLNISGVAIVGIEYDIAAPSTSGDTMRVSHGKAMQATLDVFCQYLWDRVSQDPSSTNPAMNQQAQSVKSKVMSSHSNRMSHGGNEQNAVYDAEVAAMAKANSYPSGDHLSVQREREFVQSPMNLSPRGDEEEEELTPVAAFDPDLIPQIADDNEGS